MKKAFLTLLALGLLAVGCKKDPEIDNAATEANANQANAAANTPANNATLSGSNSESSAALAGANGDLESVYFRFDQFIIEGESNINAIKRNVAKINGDINEVRVEGNTDEWGSDEYNYALALKRAASVKDALVANNVPESKIRLVSYGESKPKCLEKTKECWRENRRADFVLVK